MRGKRVPAESITAALLDAATMGTRAAAAKHGISRRLLVGARPESALVCATLAAKRAEFLHAALDAAKVKLGQNISSRALARLIEVVGDLDIAARLTVEREDGQERTEGPRVAAPGTIRGDGPVGLAGAGRIQ